MPSAADQEETACAAVLRGLSGTDEPAEAADAVLRAVRALNSDASLVLLEGLTRLARFPPAEDAALQALLVCAARSAAVWESVICAGIPVLFPRFGQLVADTFVPEDPVVQNGVEPQLIYLSANPAATSYHLPVTPASLAIHVMFSERNVDAKNVARRGRFVTKLPGAVWMHLQNSDVAKVVVGLSADGADADSLQGALRTRIHRAFAAPTPTAARICMALETMLPAEAAALRARLGPQLAPMLVAESAVSDFGEDVHDPASAYALGRTAQKAGNISKAMAAAKQFKASGRLDLAGAIYIACPKVFSRVEDVTEDLAKAICKLPEWFRSPVDASLDCALRWLLGAIPALVKVYGGLQKMQSRRDAELALQRAALAHPALMLRRMDGMCAAAFAVLEGLPERNDRYDPHALFAVQNIFASIFRVQTETKVREMEVLEVGLMAKDLLLDEGRDQNGIPMILAPFAVTVLQILSMYPKEVKNQKLGQVFQRVHGAPGTVDDVKRAVASFLSKTEA